MASPDKRLGREEAEVPIVADGASAAFGSALRRMAPGSVSRLTLRWILHGQQRAVHHRLHGRTTLPGGATRQPPERARFGDRPVATRHHAENARRQPGLVEPGAEGRRVHAQGGEVDPRRAGMTRRRSPSDALRACEVCVLRTDPGGGSA